MKITTWNVNSVRVREERLLRFLERESPDLVCLQELKATDQQFPYASIEAAGYEAAVHGQATYNGVAILSRLGLSEIHCGMSDGTDDHQARLISATIAGVRVLCAYVPNGKTVGSEKYAYKMEWLNRLLRHLETTTTPDRHLILCGDLNIAPYDSDVARLDEWAGSVLCHEDARAALQALCDWGLEDVFHLHHPEGGIYTWWDYRMLGFAKGNGLRIDHILATRDLASRCTDARVDRDERKGSKPSDHAPVIAEFSI